MPTIILYGPEAQGRSQVVINLLHRYRLCGAVADWQPGDTIIDGALHCCNRHIEPDERNSGATYIEFKPSAANCVMCGKHEPDLGENCNICQFCAENAPRSSALVRHGLISDASAFSTGHNGKNRLRLSFLKTTQRGELVMAHTERDTKLPLLVGSIRGAAENLKTAKDLAEALGENELSFFLQEAFLKSKAALRRAEEKQQKEDGAYPL